MKKNKKENYDISYEIFVGKELKKRFITFKPDVTIDFFQKSAIKWRIQANNDVYFVEQKNYNSEINWNSGEPIPEIIKQNKNEIEEQIGKYIDDHT